jgi:hypothetical protein
MAAYLCATFPRFYNSVIWRLSPDLFSDVYVTRHSFPLFIVPHHELGSPLSVVGYNTR